MILRNLVNTTDFSSNNLLIYDNDETYFFNNRCAYRLVLHFALVLML